MAEFIGMVTLVLLLLFLLFAMYKLGEATESCRASSNVVKWLAANGDAILAVGDRRVFKLIYSALDAWDGERWESEHPERVVTDG